MNLYLLTIETWPGTVYAVLIKATSKEQAEFLVSKLRNSNYIFDAHRADLDENIDLGNIDDFEYEIISFME